MAGFLAGFGQGLLDYSNQLNSNAYRQALLQLDQQNRQLQARQVLAELSERQRQQQAQSAIWQAYSRAAAQPSGAELAPSSPTQQSSLPQIPDFTGQMADNSAVLGLIDRDESGGRNVNNYRFDPTHTAGGRLQITDSTWNRYAPQVGAPQLHYPLSPKDRPVDEQFKVGGAIYNKEGAAPWANFNPKLAADLKLSPEAQQQGGQVAVRAAGMLPPQMVGRAGPDVFARMLQNLAGTDAPDDVKGAALMHLLPLMSQEGQRSFQQAMELLNYQQRGAHEQAEETGQADARAETARHNRVMEGKVDPAKLALQRYLEENPNATAEEIQSFIQRGRSARSGPAMAAQRYLQEHPDATSEDIRDFVAQTAAQTSATRQFDVGKQGDTVRSLNVAIDHLAVLQDAADALQNGDTKRLNQVGNIISKELGYPAPTEFGAVKSIVKDELVKAVLGGAGALGDRQEVEKQLDDANSPEQMIGVIRRYEQLMGGQMRGLKQQFITSNAGDEGAFNQKLLPRTQEVLKRAGSPAEGKGGGHKVGDIIEKGGKRWRVIGGDPNDPDVEPVKPAQ